jgi:hypothetical protein
MLHTNLIGRRVRVYIHSDSELAGKCGEVVAAFVANGSLKMSVAFDIYDEPTRTFDADEVEVMTPAYSSD